MGNAVRTGVHIHVLTAVHPTDDWRRYSAWNIHYKYNTKTPIVANVMVMQSGLEST
jgi:hypothetical protein